MTTSYPSFISRPRYQRLLVRIALRLESYLPTTRPSMEPEPHHLAAHQQPSIPFSILLLLAILVGSCTPNKVAAVSPPGCTALLRISSQPRRQRGCWASSIPWTIRTHQCPSHPIHKTHETCFHTPYRHVLPSGITSTPDGTDFCQSWPRPLHFVLGSGINAWHQLTPNAPLPAFSIHSVPNFNRPIRLSRFDENRKTPNLNDIAKEAENRLAKPAKPVPANAVVCLISVSGHKVSQPIEPDSLVRLDHPQSASSPESTNGCIVSSVMPLRPCHHGPCHRAGVRSLA